MTQVCSAPPKRKRRAVPAKWRKLFALIPKYDPIATAAPGDWFDADKAEEAVAFFAECLTHIEGAKAREPFILEPWQQAVVGCVFGWMAEDGYRRYREVLLYIPRKNGKALALDTPIPTPDGWKTMGEIQAGDTVFDDRGARVKVLEAHSVMNDHECFRVCFSDHTSIVADADHLWRTRMRKPCLPDGLRTTREISRTLYSGNRETHCEHNHEVGLPDPLQCDFSRFAIPPYALGVWLSEGDSDCARITINAKDTQILAELKDCGVQVGTPRIDPRNGTAMRVRLGSVNGSASKINTLLRLRGLLHDKHIPTDYLRASIDQRTSLLQGIMDGDGYVSKSGQCELVTIYKHLLDGVLELLRSLGYKPTVKTDRAMIGDKDCGVRYRVSFWSYQSAPAFRLLRKKERLKREPTKRARSRSRYITHVDPVPSVPVRCIRVDSPRGMFLAGRGMVPTHNTPMAAGIAIASLFLDGEYGAQNICAASSSDQATLLFRHTKGMIEQEPELSRRSMIHGGVGQRAIYYKAQGSGFKVVSSEASTQHGGNGHLAIIDELHAQKNRDLVDVIETSMASANRRQPLLISLTTADLERESICNEKYEYAVKVADGAVDDHRFLPIIYEADREDDWTDEKVWERANPNIDVSVSREYLRSKCKKAQNVPGFENTFLRLHLNVRTEQLSRWLSMEKWRACAADVMNAERWRRETLERLRGRECFAGLDLGLSNDLCAFLLTFPEDDGFTLLPWFWMPHDALLAKKRKFRTLYQGWVDQGFIEVTTGEPTTDYAAIRARANQLADQFSIREIAVDRAFNSMQICTDLAKDGFEVVRYAQSMIALAAPTRRTEELVLAGKLWHGANPVLTWMASNACTVSDAAGTMYKVVKPSRSSPFKVDGIIAAVLTIGRAMVDEMGGDSIYETRGPVVD